MKVWDQCRHIAQECQHSFYANKVTQLEDKVEKKIKSESEKYNLTLKRFFGTKSESVSVQNHLKRAKLFTKLMKIEEQNMLQ